ncbi:hypothetical protein ACIG56_01020 [Nocardia fusca]
MTTQQEIVVDAATETTAQSGLLDFGSCEPHLDELASHLSRRLG